MKKVFVSLCNNPNKIFPTVHLEMKEYEYDKKIILYFYVFESSDVHKTANKIYDRKEEGNFEVGLNTSLLSNMYIRKSSSYFESKVYPYVTIDNLRQDLIEQAKIMANNKTANHPWMKMTNEEMLRSAGLYEENFQTGQKGYNLACILIFGKDEVIQSVLSYYRVDALLRRRDVERYDDRDDIRTNLLESYERLIRFIQKHLNDKFYLEDDKRINIRDIIAREVCVNLLIHREYANPYPTRLIIEKEMMVVENANRPRMIGYLDLDDYFPYPKNPKIANFFKEIGLADELGSGIKKITKYSKIYSGVLPKFREDDIFKAFIPLSFECSDCTYIDSHNVSTRGIRKLILNFLSKDDGKTRKEINEYIYPLLEGDDKSKENKIRWSLTYLKRNELIINAGTDKKTMWKKVND